MTEHSANGGASERSDDPNDGMSDFSGAAGFAEVNLSEAGLGHFLDDARERHELLERLAALAQRRGDEGELSREIALEIVREAVSIVYPDRSIPPLLIDAAAAWIAAACWSSHVARTRLEALWAEAKGVVSS